MIQLTHEEINNIINLTKPYVKEVCDRIYNKAVEDIGRNDYFKSIIDRSFEKICEIEIENIKNLFNSYFIPNQCHNISIDDIEKSLHNYNPVCCITARGGRSGGKMLHATSVIINKSVKQAFVEKLAEYIKVDISEIIN